MEEVLVTGCAGFIGSHLTSGLLKDGYKVVGISLDKESADFTIYKGDIRDKEAIEKVFTENAIQRVVHLAALSSIRSPESLEQYLDTNIKGTAHLLEACRKNGVEQVVFASSSTVYGEGNAIPFTEGEEVCPSSLYGLTKRVGELLCFSYSKRYSLPSVCLRFFTVYGEGGRQDMAIRKFTDLISRGEPVPRFGDGKAKRDYVHVSDVVESIQKALKMDAGCEIINIGSGRATDINSLIRMIEKEVGRKADVVEVDNPPGEMLATQANIAKARRLLGWEPRVGLEEGIRRFVAWYKGQHETAG